MISNHKMTSEIPPVRLTEIKLLNLSYRASSSEIVTNNEAKLHLEGNIALSFREKRKYSFKVRARQEIKVEGALLRVTHEARFTSQSTLPKEIFRTDDLERRVIDIILPFASELFAILTGKSFVVPVIAPGELPEEVEEGES